MMILETSIANPEAQRRAGPTASRSHYHDAALHRAIAETAQVDGRGLLYRAAASAAYRTLQDVRDGTTAEALRELLRACGLGEVEQVEVTLEGLDLVLNPSPFATARREMFGVASGPACDVTRGVLSGALEALMQRGFEVQEVACVAAGDQSCRFVAGPAAETLCLEESPYLALTPIGLSLAKADSFDLGELGEFHADGSLGATYGRLWADLYARAAHEFEVEVPKKMGSKFANLAAVLLTEAAHIGTFYSIGGLIRSATWKERVAPRLESREHWLQTIVALFDQLGWGHWAVQLLAPSERLTVQVHDAPETLSRLALAGPASAPRCYFARGVSAALMNVLYVGDAVGPAALNQSVYNALFRSPSSFRAIETQCQAMGHPYCEFVANPLSPGTRRF